MSANTLLVNGHDLRGFSWLLIDGDMGLFAPGTRRGAALVIPGRRGQVGVELPYDAYQFSVPVIIEGADRADMVARILELGSMLAGTNGLVTLERQLANSGGGYDSYTASGQFVSGVAVEQLNDRTGSTELLFINLDGAWSPDFGVTWVVP